MKKLLIIVLFLALAVLGVGYYKHKNIVNSRDIILQNMQEVGFNTKNIDFKFSGFPFNVSITMRNIKSSKIDFLKMVNFFKIDYDLLKLDKKNKKELQKIINELDIEIEKVIISFPFLKWNQAKFDMHSVSVYIKPDGHKILEKTPLFNINKTNIIMCLKPLVINSANLTKTRLTFFELIKEKLKTNDKINFVIDEIGYKNESKTKKFSAKNLVLELSGKFNNKKINNFAFNIQDLDLTQIKNVNKINMNNMQVVYDNNNVLSIQKANSKNINDMHEVNHYENGSGIKLMIPKGNLTKTFVLKDATYKSHTKFISPIIPTENIKNYFQNNQFKKDFKAALQNAYDTGANNLPFLDEILTHLDQSKYKLKYHINFDSNLSKFDIRLDFGFANKLPDFNFTFNRTDDDELMKFLSSLQFKNEDKEIERFVSFFEKNKKIVIKTKNNQIFLNDQIIFQIPEIDLAQLPIVSPNFLSSELKDFSYGKYFENVAKKLNNASNPIMQIMIAKGYFKDKIYDKTITILNKIKHQNFPIINYFYAYLYYGGFGVQKDLEKSKDYIQQAVDKDLTIDRAFYFISDIVVDENFYDWASKFKSKLIEEKN